jgi:hypothetical protein
MTRRMWGWVAALTLLAAIDLSATIRAHARWQPPPDSQASLTLPQLLGFASSAALIVVVGLILVSGWQTWRQRRRLASWRADVERPGGQSGVRYLDLGDPQ